ncbi:hypothetical protein [Halorientalis pallida]|uniref:Uncharacterized protein n=1 Tax=Halorientalis pallida TaxID=2479928 RepID=A0A498KV98_9EURY|nr:hypothetical protein [Halorientalis pallida]RXK49117.1 hypothetical protein EAF64_09310 [Halorientalis pallida]
MTEDLSDDRDAFLAMARAFPLRTCLFTLGLPAFALLQVSGGLLTGGPIAFGVLLALLAVGLSVVVTRYHVARYRRQRVTDAPKVGR